MLLPIAVAWWLAKRTPGNGMPLARSLIVRHGHHRLVPRITDDVQPPLPASSPGIQIQNELLVFLFVTTTPNTMGKIKHDFFDRPWYAMQEPRLPNEASWTLKNQPILVAGKEGGSNSSQKLVVPFRDEKQSWPKAAKGGYARTR
jgi:hypothetical protein